MAWKVAPFAYGAMMAKITIVKCYEDTRGVGTCRSCGARLTWIQTLAGKRMPFDQDPAPVQTEAENQTGRLIGFYSSDDVHWRTCPDADKFRQKQYDTGDAY